MIGTTAAPCPRWAASSPWPCARFPRPSRCEFNRLDMMLPSWCEFRLLPTLLARMRARRSRRSTCTAATAYPLRNLSTNLSSPSACGRSGILRSHQRCGSAQHTPGGCLRRLAQLMPICRSAGAQTRISACSEVQEVALASYWCSVPYPGVRMPATSATCAAAPPMIRGCKTRALDRASLIVLACRGRYVPSERSLCRPAAARARYRG